MAAMSFPQTCEQCPALQSRIAVCEKGLADVGESVRDVAGKVDRLTTWMMGAVFSALLASSGWVVVLLRGRS